uniref:Uncharacterized protein n=1 Tax=viral metagenome TaxID=1070528 RepID=A0A2V0RI88_9ZZZZ
MKFKYLTSSFEVNLPNKENENDWIVVVSESSSYNKEEVLVNAFEKDFPEIKLIGNDVSSKYIFLTSVTARSKALLKWYAAAKLSYSELTQLPLYLADHVHPSEFIKVREKASEINVVVSEFSKRAQSLAREYSEKLKKIENERDEAISEIKLNDNLIKIVTLQVIDLPLSIQMSIEGYAPKDISRDVSESRRVYARECLTTFKVSLLKLINDEPEVDINDIVKELGLK